MAKRGYRGAHPHNDMKVSPNPKSNKYSSKLTTEYNNLKNDKTRYDYIRTHYFYPQATATVVCHASIATDDAITLISTDGTSVEYVAKTGNSFANNQFKQNDSSGDGEAVNTATNLKSAIEHASGHNGKLVVSQDSATLTITQAEPGPDGNKSITQDLTSATVSSAFTGG
tara:strand:- start:304 stop:813 length:510 start_codon:yes stop_codon:yes gene_type:complete